MTPLALVRAVNMAAGAVALGLPAVLLLIVAPLAGARQAVANEIFRQLARAAFWVLAAALAVALASGLAWAILEAASMSGSSTWEAIASGAVGTLLLHTGFGRATLVRLGCVVVLALCLPSLRHAGRAAVALGIATVAGAVGFVALAWTGHAAATEGAAGILHLVADGSHLLAAGVWLGGLVALAMLFAAVCRAPKAAAVRFAAAASRRFSPLGIVCVATLIVSGVVNTWLLVGDLPHLLGTQYGVLLLAKVAVFALMIIVAGLNRTFLTPRLAAREDSGALAWLQRNCVVEAVLGLAVVAIVGALGQLPPGLHDTVVWPFAARLSSEALVLPDVNRDVGVAVLAVALGVMLLVVAAVSRATRLWAVPAGLALIVFFVATPFRLLSVAAFPTSFQLSPVPYQTESIARGMMLFATNCAICHGASGRGDGAGAAGLATSPADLTAPHVLEHSEGELFWWIGNGIADTPMPGFAAALGPDARWDLVNFVRTLPVGGLPTGLTDAVGDTAPAAPDFPFETADGSQTTLRERATAGPLLLVLADDAGSPARLDALAAMQPQLIQAGLSILVLVGDGVGEATEGLPRATVDPSVRAVYRLVAMPLGKDAGRLPAHLEFLIDRNGFIRAVARGLAAANGDDAARLQAQLQQLAGQPLAPLATGHVH